MNGFLVPANTKKAQLIMGFLRGIDAIILGTGIGVSVILLIIIGGNVGIWLTLGACMPGIICGLLVLPIPNYHNTLVALQSIYRFYSERRNFIWKGWCIYDEHE